MILTELHQYIDNEGVAARSELASKFGMSEDGVDAMLSVWVKKGKFPAWSIPTSMGIQHVFVTPSANKMVCHLM